MKLIQIKLSVTNCYLVKNQDKYILIDTGHGNDWELFISQLEKVDIKINDISHIFLTHHDEDHSGLLNNIINENNNIRVIMSHLAKDLLTVGSNDRTHGGGFINRRIFFIISKISLKRLKIMLKTKKYLDKHDNLKFPPYFVRNNDIMIFNDIFLKEIGININGKIISTPGHTVDSISIIFDDGDCIVGDAAANILQFFGSKYCAIRICDLDDYYQSWNKLLIEKVRIIYPAHGKAFTIDKLVKNIYKNKKRNMVLS